MACPVKDGGNHVCSIYRFILCFCVRKKESAMGIGASGPVTTLRRPNRREHSHRLFCFLSNSFSRGVSTSSVPLDDDEDGSGDEQYEEVDRDRSRGAVGTSLFALLNPGYTRCSSLRGCKGPKICVAHRSLQSGILFSSWRFRETQLIV